jgi:hypothetical protein
MLHRSQAGIRTLEACYWAMNYHKPKGEKQMSTNGTNGTNGNSKPISEKVVFTPNVPQKVAIKFAQPKIVTGNYGESAMFSLVDGRVMFLDVDAAMSILSDVRPKVGEEFYVQMDWSGKKGEPRIWHGWKAGGQVGEQPNGTFAVPASDADPRLMQQMRDSIALANAKKQNGANGGSTSAPLPATSQQLEPHDTQHTTASPAQAEAPRGSANGATAAAPDRRPPTKLEYALMTVVQACHAAQEFARTIGYASMPQFSSEDVRCMANTLIIQSEQNGGKR